MLGDQDACHSAGNITFIVMDSGPLAGQVARAGQHPEGIRLCVTPTLYARRERAAVNSSGHHTKCYGPATPSASLSTGVAVAAFLGRSFPRLDL